MIKKVRTRKGVTTMKHVYFFSAGKADGCEKMKNLLGGKGANLAEMCNLGLPVPPGFTITTDCCLEYFRRGLKFPAALRSQVELALRKVEDVIGMKFGDPTNPLLVSCRSGARQSMPGMMESVLNLGLCSKTIPALIAKMRNERFVWYIYCRLMVMYSAVVMEKAEGIKLPEGEGIQIQLDSIMQEMKRIRGIEKTTDLSADDLKKLCTQFKACIRQVLGREFPDDPLKQLWGSIGAVFKSWNGDRAISFRRIEGIPDDWGTAVNVQAMVFGNLGDTSATGVAFSRNPATGENNLYGEWLPNAQGEEIVRGTRTPNPLNEFTKGEYNVHLPSLEQVMPTVYRQLDRTQRILERHYCDMQDIEFTIQQGKLFMLQCRIGKRTGAAALKIAMDMLAEGLISEEEAVLRLSSVQPEELLYPIIDSKAEESALVITKGLPAGPGGACGQIVFTSRDAVNWAKEGKKVILVRDETKPEDVEGMRAANGILTARGGMTSHAALIARGWGKCCIVGASALVVEAVANSMTIEGKTFRQGDFLTLNGTKGYVYAGEMPMVSAAENPQFQKFMEIVDKYRRLGVRTNADTPADAKVARNFDAEGIGLF